MQFQLIRNPKHYLFIAVTNHSNSKKESGQGCWGWKCLLRRGIADNHVQVLIQWMNLGLHAHYINEFGQNLTSLLNDCRESIYGGI